MNKQYIFFTTGIKDLGGVELYLLNKCKFLLDQGWDVHVFSATYTKKSFKIKELERYRKEILPILEFTPYECSKKTIEKVISKIKNVLMTKNKFDEIIIESHAGTESLWGELLAQELKATHFIAFLHETFTDNCYIDKKEFFLFKLNRSEIYAGKTCKENLIIKKWGQDGSRMVSNRIQYSPVMDIDDCRLKQIKKADYTICYIGRTEKAYFESIIDGAYMFSKRHLDKSIQLVILGNEKIAKRIIKKYCKRIDNIDFVLLGEVCPIPRELYSLVDCVCASAGSAKCSAMEGIPVIIPDLNTKLANGVFGYDTQESISRSDEFEPIAFVEEFESVLIKKDYLNKPFIIPRQATVAEACLFILDSLHKSQYFGKNIYYDKRIICEGEPSFKRRVLARLVSVFPSFLYHKRMIIKRKRI